MTGAELTIALATPIAAAIGSFVGMRVTVARLRQDVQTLFEKVDAMSMHIGASQLEQEREHGEVKVALAKLEARVESLDSPWKRKS